jgi:hypothetical protein
MRSGVPVPGANVRVHRRGAHEPSVAEVRWTAAAASVTGADGVARLDVPAGPLLVIARARGAAPARRELPAGTDRNVVELRLGPGLQIRGQVVDARNGQAVPSAALTVRVADEPESEHVRLRSGPSGEFVLQDLAEGPFTVTAEAPSYSRLVLESRAPASGPLLLRLGASAFLTGHVLDAQGRPVLGATVTALCRPGPVSEVTDARGAYSVEVPPGTHQLSAQLGAAAAALEHPVAVGAGQTRSGLDLRLGAAGTFTGRVTSGGRAVPGIAILLSPRGMRGDSGHATSGADGRWEIAGLPSGAYDLDAVAEGWSLEQRPGLRLLAGQRFPVDLELRPGGTVVGVVRDANGPVAAASVTVAVVRTQTDDLGRFRLDGLTAGDVTVSARRPGSTVVASLALGPAATAEVDLELPGEGTVEVGSSPGTGSRRRGRCWDSSGCPKDAPLR